MSFLPHYECQVIRYQIGSPSPRDVRLPKTAVNRYMWLPQRNGQKKDIKRYLPLSFPFWLVGFQLADDLVKPKQDT